MTNNQLLDWIKSQEALGYSKEQLRSYLLKLGYDKRLIDTAIQPRRTGFKKFIQPSLLKLFFPLLFLLFIIVSYSINLTHAPQLGKLVCERVNNEDKENSAEIMAHAKPLFLGNMYLVPVTNILNPFFPVSCEISYLKPNSRCSYYITESDYNCIAGYKGKRDDLMKAFLELPIYKKINLEDLIFHSLLLLLITYLLICIVSWIFYAVKQKSKKFKLAFTGFILLLPVIALFLLNAFYPLIFYLFVLIFAILLFINKESTQKLILYISSGLLLLLLVVGLFVADFFITRMFSELIGI